MYKNNLYILIIVLALFVQSCSRKVDFKELISYIKNTENGLLKEFTYKDTHVTVMYKPTDIIVYQELKRYSKPDKKIIDSLINIYNKHAYFDVKLSYDNEELLSRFMNDEALYGKLKSELTDGAKYFKLTNKTGKELSAEQSVFVDLSNLTQCNNLLVVFNKEDLDKFGDFTFTFNGTAFESEIVSLEYKSRDIKRIPKLKI